MNSYTKFRDSKNVFKLQLITPFFQIWEAQNLSLFGKAVQGAFSKLTLRILPLEDKSHFGEKSREDQRQV